MLPGLLVLLGCPTPPATPDPPPPVESTAETADTALPVETGGALETPPNLLVFLLDDLGPERFQMHADLGSERIARTPVIDAIADSGVVFDRAYATPLCSSTRAALLTSRLAFRTGIGSAIHDFENVRLPLDERTIAEALLASPTPWTTAAFGKWHLTAQTLPDWQDDPNVQGFQHFDGSIQNLWGYDTWARTVDGTSTVATGYHTRVMTEATVDWLQTAPEPWFVYVPMAAAHAPWHTPPANFRYTANPGALNWSGRLDLMMETIDISIGLILASLTDEVRDRTYVVVVADNGTPEQVAEPPADPARAKGTLSEGGVRVPMIIAGPGIEPGRTEALASVLDIWPTLFELVGEPMPTDRPIDGISLVPVLADPTQRVRTHLYIDAAGHTPNPPKEQRGQTLIADDYKLTLSQGSLSFHRITEGVMLEGPNLLDGPMTPADQAAFGWLWAEYERMEAETQATWNP